jgi:possible ribokinase
MKVLNYGSLNIDYVYSLDHFVKRGETISSDSLDIFPGGKGLNQSLALGRAGAKVFHAGAIGKDGMFLLDLLKNSGIQIEHVRVLEGVQTGTAIIQKEKSGDNCIILYSGANHEISEKDIEETFQNFSEGDVLILQNEINAIGRIMEEAHQKGMQIILNPSPMNESILQLPLEFVHYFILNEIEAAQILKLDLVTVENAEKIVRELHQRYPQSKIVLTLGAEGSLYFDGELLLRQNAYKAKVVDTTAAGDTFTGYFVAGILNGDSVKTAMERATHAAAIAISRLGAAPSIPYAKEL